MKSYINLSDLEYRAQPFDAFTRLREQGPLVQARLPFLGKTWLVTTYQGVNDVLKNDQLFCRDPRRAGKRRFLLFHILLPGLFKRLSQNMLGMDEPDHRRLRTLVDQAFQRQHIEDLRPRITTIVDRQLDHLVEVAAQTGGEVDLIEHLARPIPLTVICEVLGLPEADRPKFKAWFSNFAHIKSAWTITQVVPGLRKTLKYLRNQFEQVRREPRPGLTTLLVQAEQDGERLSNDELQSMVMLLLLAGQETTVHLLSNGILTLLQLPQVQQTLREDPSKLEPAVEEILRVHVAGAIGETPLCGP